MTIRCYCVKLHNDNDSFHANKTMCVCVCVKFNLQLLALQVHMINISAGTFPATYVSIKTDF
jgi:hypothetical protein